MRYYGVIILSMVAALTACGGGGGSPGTSNFGSGSSQAGNNYPVIKTSLLKDSANLDTTSIAASGYTFLYVMLVDPHGNPISGQVIDVSGDATQVSFPEGPSGLTDASGLAKIKIARASLSASGAGALTVTYSYKVGNLQKYPDGSATPTSDKVITVYTGYQLVSANVTLSNFNVGGSPLPAYGTQTVSVQANVNGTPSSSPIQVSFTASCGQMLPAAITTDSNGVATVSYSATDPAGATQSTLGCSGQTVTISASAQGAGAITNTLNIASAPATNMSFLDATPTRIYLANSGSQTQSIVRFKLVNARGDPQPNQNVILSLKTLNGGTPKATLGKPGNINPSPGTTDGSGIVSIPVFSGTVPTNVLVNAMLVSNSAVQSDSAVLTIASGRPAQARVSLSLEKFSIEGANIDGEESSVTMSLADRQGNPVPDGTAVNFVTSGGVMIPPTCITGAISGDSQCSVKIRAQNPRSQNGRVYILAYAAGEEDFVDANFNNVYDCGESFTDLGTAYLDSNHNGVYDPGEFSVPRAGSPSTCGTATTPTPMKGDGVFGGADVRAQMPIVFATSHAKISGSIGGGTLNLTIGDDNGNSMPTGSSVAVTGTPTGAGSLGCAVNANALFTIPNSLAPSTVPVSYVCKTGDTLTVQVTTPNNIVTNQQFIVP